jgi:hypothetical protein
MERPGTGGMENRWQKQAMMNWDVAKDKETRDCASIGITEITSTGTA